MSGQKERYILREKSEKTLDRIFRLLAMDHPPVEVYSAFRALFSDNTRIRANAIEYLDNVLKTPHKNLVLGLVEGHPPQQQLRRQLSDLGETVEEWPQVLHSQTAHGDDWLAACALYTIWATGQESLYRLFDLSPAADGSGPLAVETARQLRQRVRTAE